MYQQLFYQYLPNHIAAPGNISYKRNQPEFVAACEKWKKTGPGWQKNCDVKPRSLPAEFAALASQMYMSGCNRYTGKRVFDSPPLEEVMERLRSYDG